jgi:pimeloyl-ACP methyl ester carboxylesterase
MRRTIQLLSSGPAILVGSSLGGWLAAEVGVWFPELVSALVLIDPVGLRIDGSPIYNIFGTPGTDHQAELMARGNPHGVDTISPLIPAFADTDVPFEVGMMMHFARAMAATARIGWNPYLHDPRLMGRLSSVLAPTLVLWGADDGIVPRTHADAYVEGIPGAILEVIPHSGHTPVLDQPFLAAASVIEFLTAQLGEVGTLDQAPVVTSN